jgi:hypothetical protein
MDAIEDILLAKLNKYKIISTRDVFQLPEGKDVSFFTQYFDYLKIFCDDKEKLNEYKFKFLDWEINKDFEDNSIFNDLPTISEKSKFISSKVLISKGKQFSCKANYLLNKHLDNSEENVILSREFEKEIEFFKIYNEREESTTSPSVA